MPLSDKMMAAIELEEKIDTTYFNSIDIFGYEATHDRVCSTWYGTKYTCDCRLMKITEAIKLRKANPSPSVFHKEN